MEPAAAIDDRDARLLADIRRGAEADVRALLKKGANANAKDEKMGLSALTLAINSGFPALVEMLIGAGADVNERDARNRTRLEYAIDKYTVARFVRTSLSDKHAAPYAKKIAGIIAAAPRLSAAMKASTGATIADHARKAGLDEIADSLAAKTQGNQAAGTVADL